ncbi:MAG: MFS transporter, partial [Candidatus Magasanikbacteria bacterium]|nr:MFS transporter [Candidatus Magasanikbacteria bacterium]
MKMNNRAVELPKNFKRMFWIQALMNFKLLNTVISIFYAHRGLSLQQIFLLGVVFAVTNLLFEIPSSYAADRWGRKKTIAVAIAFLAISSICDFFAHSFLFFAVDLIFYSLSFSFMTGTDDALIYDTGRELGEEKNSTKELGNYYSAQRFFKILTPLLAVAIASGLLEWQFKIIIAIEFVTTIIALPFVARLVEPV